jgi:hypothetical protein
VVVFTDLSTLDAARPLISHWRGWPKPTCPLRGDERPNVVGYIGKEASASHDVYERAVAEMVLDERRVVLDTSPRPESTPSMCQPTS